MQVGPRTTPLTKCNFLKSDLIERRLNKFTMARAGDGNLRSNEPIVKPEDFMNTTNNEHILVNLTIKIASGGLKDFVVVSFHPDINTNIHVAKPVENITFGEVVFHSQKMGAQWFEDEQTINGQLIPRISTSDRLAFYVTNKKNVSLLNIRSTFFTTIA